MGKECPTPGRTGSQGPHPGGGSRQSESDQGPTNNGPTAGPGGLAPLEPAGGRGAPHPDRSPGPKVRGGCWAETEFAESAATQPRAKVDRQWPEVSMYQVLSHVFARCASQKTHGHARIACENCKRFRAILACPCVSVQCSHVRVFSDSRNVQKSVTEIIYLGPLPGASYTDVLLKF